MPRSTLTSRLSNKQALDTRSPCERKGGKMVVTAVAAAARGEGNDKKVPYPPSSSSSSSSQDDAPSPPFLRRLAGAVTLEPVIFFYMVVDSSFPSNIQIYSKVLLLSVQFGNAIVQGSAVNTDMLMWKVCRYEFAYNETVCEDLDQDEYEDQEDEGENN